MIFLTVIVLTLLDGRSVWVESTHIQSIRAPDGHCAHGAHSIVRFDAGGGILCVKETPAEIRNTIEGAPK